MHLLNVDCYAPVIKSFYVISLWFLVTLDPIFCNVFKASKSSRLKLVCEVEKTWTDAARRAFRLTGTSLTEYRNKNSDFIAVSKGIIGKK